MFSDNDSRENAKHGFNVKVDNNTLLENRATDNEKYGFKNSGDDNEYVDNECSGNGNGGSDPPGLCD